MPQFASLHPWLSEFAKWISAEFVDFHVFYEAGGKALQHRTVYDVVDHFQFKYSPLASLLFGMLYSRFEFNTAAGLHAVISITMSLAVLILLARDPNQRARTAWILPWFLASFQLELRLGQINILPFLLAFLALSALQQKRDILTETRAGFLLSCAVQLKLCWAIIVLLWVFHKRWRAISLFALITAILNLGVLGWYSGVGFAIGELSRWLVTLTLSTSELTLNGNNVSLLAILSRGAQHLRFVSPLVPTILFLILGCSVIPLALHRARKSSALRQFAILCAMIYLFNPIVWPNWALLLLPLCLEASSLPSVSRRSRFEKAALWIVCFALGSSVGATPVKNGLLVLATGLALSAIIRSIASVVPLVEPPGIEPGIAV